MNGHKKKMGEGGQRNSSPGTQTSRQAHAWHVMGMARKLEWQMQSEQEVGPERWGGGTHHAAHALEAPKGFGFFSELNRKLL